MRIVGRMQSNDLTPAQAGRILNQVHPTLVYLRHLLKRMNKRRIPNDDPLLQSTLNAYDAVHELHVHLNYLSCRSGVRRLPAGLGDEGD
jgi:hypothetical protein